MNIEELTARLDKLEGMVRGLLQIQGIEASRVVAPEEASSAPLAGAAPLLRPQEEPKDAATVEWNGSEFVQHGEVFKPRTHTEPQEQSPAPPPKPSAPLPQSPQPRQPATIPAQIPVTSQAVPANPPPPEPTPREQRQHRAAWRAEQRRENIRSQGRQTNVDRMDEPYRAAYYDAAGIPEPPKSPATKDAMRAPRSGGDERLAEIAEVTASTLHVMQQRLTLAMRQIEEMRRLFEMTAHE